MHTHKWRLGEWIFQPSIEEMNNLYAVCIGEHCHETLSKVEIERRLNAVEALSSQFAIEIAMGIEESGLGRITSDAPVLREYARILEGTDE
jgi:hypothetical protein